MIKVPLKREEYIEICKEAGLDVVCKQGLITNVRGVLKYEVTVGEPVHWTTPCEFTIWNFEGDSSNAEHIISSSENWYKKVNKLRFKNIETKSE